MPTAIVTHTADTGTKINDPKAYSDSKYRLGQPIEVVIYCSWNVAIFHAFRWHTSACCRVPTAAPPRQSSYTQSYLQHMPAEQPLPPCATLTHASPLPSPSHPAARPTSPSLTPYLTTSYVYRGEASRKNTTCTTARGRRRNLPRPLQRLHRHAAHSVRHPTTLVHFTIAHSCNVSRSLGLPSVCLLLFCSSTAESDFDLTLVRGCWLCGALCTRTRRDKRSSHAEFLGHALKAHHASNTVRATRTRQHAAPPSQLACCLLPSPARHRYHTCSAPSLPPHSCARTSANIRQKPCSRPQDAPWSIIDMRKSNH